MSVPSLELVQENCRLVGVVFKTLLSAREVTGPDKSTQRFATVAMFLRSCVVQTLSRGDDPATRYMLARNTANVIKV